MSPVILVAGGSGFIGSAAVRRLIARGEDVAVMTAHPERSARRIGGMGARVVPGDVQHPASLGPAVSEARVVVQTLTFPTFPVEKPSRGYTFEEYEHLGTQRLVQAAGAAGVRKFVYCSGVGVGPDAPSVWFRAKWAGEKAIEAAGLPHAIIRPSWAYGPGDRALNRIARFARYGPAVPVIGNGEQRLQPVFVNDVAEALAQAAMEDGPQGVYEIGGPDVLTMNEVLRTMLAVMGKRRPLVHFPPWVPKAAGWCVQWLPSPPLSPDAVDFATADALADTTALLHEFDLRLTAFRDGLSTYLAG